MALVTFDLVAAAAEALQAAGQRASVRAVTAALGGGSPNSVLRFLTEYKAGRPVVRVADVDLDHRITDAIRAQMQDVAGHAAAAAEERASALDDDLQALAEAQADAEKHIAGLTSERDAAQAQSADFSQKLGVVQADAARAQVQAADVLAVLRSELAGERERHGQAAAALARAEVRLEVVPALQADVDRLRAALASAHDARVQAEQTGAVLTAKLESAERRALEADLRTGKADARADTLASDLASVHGTLQACQVRLEMADRRASDADVQTARADARADALSQDLASANGLIHDCQGRLELAARELGEVRIAASKSESELADLKRVQAQAVAVAVAVEAVAVKPAIETGQSALEL